MATSRAIMNERPSRTLVAANRRLAATWNETSKVWQDEVATRFVTNFLVPVQQSSNRYLEALEQLESAIEET